jgi:hypothetical protein
MAITPLNSFADVQTFITQVLSQNGDLGSVGRAPHKAFWTTVTYDQFVNGNVPGVSDPNTGQPMPILVKGNSPQSNLIIALLGIGPIFGANGPIGQMPENGTPFSLDQVKSIAAWIDNGCPRIAAPVASADST